MPNQIGIQRLMTLYQLKGKIEEQEVLPADSSQSQQQQIVRPKAIERPKKSQIKEQSTFHQGHRKLLEHPSTF